MKIKTWNYQLLCLLHVLKCILLLAGFIILCTDENKHQCMLLSLVHSKQEHDKFVFCLGNVDTTCTVPPKIHRQTYNLMQTKYPSHLINW